MAHGPLEAQALISGAFAAHAVDGSSLGVWDDDAWFAISHVCTGLRIAAMQGKTKARKLAKALNAALPDGRDITCADFDPAWTDDYRAFVARAKAIVQKHGGER